MAINDYVPKFDGISEFVPQMYQAINETARNTGQIRKATADTTAQGWAALQKAFTDFAEQGLQGRGLDLKEKDIAATEKYRTGDLAQRAASEFGAEGRAKGDREQRYHELDAANKRADLEAKNRLAIAGVQGDAKEKPEKVDFLGILGKAGHLADDPKTVGESIMGGPLVNRDLFKMSFKTKDDAVKRAFIPTLASIEDPKKRAMMLQYLIDWYETGAAPPGQGQGNVAPAPGQPRAAVPAPLEAPPGVDNSATESGWQLMQRLGKPLQELKRGIPQYDEEGNPLR